MIALGPAENACSHIWARTGVSSHLDRRNDSVDILLERPLHHRASEAIQIQMDCTGRSVQTNTNNYPKRCPHQAPPKPDQKWQAANKRQAANRAKLSPVHHHAIHRVELSWLNLQTHAILLEVNSRSIRGQLQLIRGQSGSNMGNTIQ